jgi:hypothetical protein
MMQGHNEFPVLNEVDHSVHSYVLVYLMGRAAGVQENNTCTAADSLTAVVLYYIDH